jgi:CRISPR/Cas system-associated exonuclease Cas4 (RecB family)
MPLRVRQVLDQIGGNSRRGLNKFLPEYALPSNTKGLFPSTILSSYSSEKYSNVGILTEMLVLTDANLTENLTHASQEQKDKIKKSKTTSDYLLKIQKTKIILNEFLQKHNLSLNDIKLDQELTGINITGHPDGIAGTNIVIEVKTSSKLETDHPYFMQQLCAYMALNTEFTHGILVLPLQEAIIVVEKWSAQDKYLNALEEKAKKLITSMPTISMNDLFNVNHLIQHYSIGKHIHKSKTMLETVTNMYPQVPYQIFIGGNMTSNLSLKDDDVKAAGEYVKNNNIKLYIHAPYIINLAAKTEDDWNIKYMHKTMRYGAQLNALGVVVHVGKSTDQKYEDAYEQMSTAVSNILEHTSPNCPLLIETPAGQGT